MQNDDRTKTVVSEATTSNMTDTLWAQTGFGVSVLQGCDDIEGAAQRMAEACEASQLTQSRLRSMLLLFARLGAAGERERLVSELKHEAARASAPSDSDSQLEQVLESLAHGLSSTTDAEPVPAPGSKSELEARMGDLLITLSRLAHTINNPLTSMMGRAQMLRLVPTSPQVEKASRVIEESAQRVAGHIQELSRIVKDGMDDLGVSREAAIQMAPEDSVEGEASPARER